MKKRDHVLRAVHDRRARKKPLTLKVHRLQSLLLLAVVVAESVRFVTDEALESHRREEERVGDDLILVRDLDTRARDLATEARPLTVRDLPDAISRVCEGRAPLTKNGERAEDESARNRTVLEQADRRDRLAEAHLVKDEATAVKRVVFALHHPVHGNLLVLVQLLAADLRNNGVHLGLASYRFVIVDLKARVLFDGREKSSIF